LPKLYSLAENAGLAPISGSGAEVRTPTVLRSVLVQRTLKSPPAKSSASAAAKVIDDMNRPKASPFAAGRGHGSGALSKVRSRTPAPIGARLRAGSRGAVRPGYVACVQHRPA